MVYAYKFSRKNTDDTILKATCLYKSFISLNNDDNLLVTNNTTK